MQNLDDLPLVEKVNYLEEENRQLRELMRDTQIIDKYLVIKKEYKLTGLLNRLLLIIYAHKNGMAKEAALRFLYFDSPKEHYNTKIIDVEVHHIRKAVGKDKIITNWGVGYYLSNEFRYELDALFYDDHQKHKTQ